MVPAVWGDPGYGESDPAVAGRAVWDKAHQPRPAHSPDLTPLDFYLGGFLKSIVCKEDSKSVTELKTAIRRAMRSVSAAMCARAIDGVMKRVNDCHLRKSSHIEHVL